MTFWGIIFKTVTISKDEQINVYDDNSYELIIKKLFGNKKNDNKSREFIPIQIKDAFYKLRVKNNSFIPWINLNKFCISIFELPIMLSPFIIEDSTVKPFLNDKLYNWVYENRYYDDVTLKEIEEIYNAFVEKYKELVI